MHKFRYICTPTQEECRAIPTHRIQDQGVLSDSLSRASLGDDYQRRSATIQNPRVLHPPQQSRRLWCFRGQRPSPLSPAVRTQASRRQSGSTDALPPKTTREPKWAVTLIRETHRPCDTFPNLGKAKLYVLLRPWCQPQLLALPDVSIIERIIASH